MSSDKSKKSGRNASKPSHQKSILERNTIKNKVRKELKNLKNNPDDSACLGRLHGYLSGARIDRGELFMSGMTELVKTAVDAAVRRNVHAGRSCAA